MSPEPSDSPAFELALAELERILRALEDGTTNLEDSLVQYERGVALLRACYQKLRDAEQRILKVTGVDADGKPILEIFEHTAAIERSDAKSRAAAGRPKPKPGDGSTY